MPFTATTIAGAHLIDPAPVRDERGFFARVWDQTELAAQGVNGAFVQCNNSFSARRGTLRGLHYQTAPHGEAKLVRCVRGAVFDVLVDVREGSPTFGRWFGAELTADNRTLMYVPEGCAHGYLTLEDASEVIYAVTHRYHREAERGIRWNDPRFAVAWPLTDGLTMSDKDATWPDYEGRGDRP